MSLEVCSEKVTRLSGCQDLWTYEHYYCPTNKQQKNNSLSSRAGRLADKTTNPSNL